MARILAIDAGTTGVRATVFAGDGTRLASAYREIVMRYPSPGWAEQDLGELWAKTQAVMSDAMRRAGMHPSAFDGIAIANQRSSIAAWDLGHIQPLSPLISWQDVRAADRANELRASGFFVTPNVSVSKAEWIVRNTPAASDTARAAVQWLRDGLGLIRHAED